MASREEYDWKNMTDDRLAIRLREEEWRARHKNKRVDRAIARKNVDAIVQEQTRRHEERFLSE